MKDGGPVIKVKLQLYMTNNCFFEHYIINFQDYVVANYCPKLDEEDQPMCEEYYGMAYVWMLVCTLVFWFSVSTFFYSGRLDPPLFHGWSSSHLPDNGNM